MHKKTSKYKDRAAGWLFAAAALICLVLAMKTPAELELEIEETIYQALNVEKSIGMFKSSDGTPASFSEPELSALIQDFDARADMYLSNENYLSASRKEANAAALQYSADKIDYTVASGIADIRLRRIEADSSGQRAVAHFSTIGWSEFVDDMDGSGTYRISCPINGSDGSAELVKENGVWKVSQYFDLSKLWERDGLYIKTAVDTNYDPDMEYATFDEALAKAETVTVEKTKNPLRLIFSEAAKLIELL